MANYMAVSSLEPHRCLNKKVETSSLSLPFSSERETKYLMKLGMASCTATAVIKRLTMLKNISLLFLGKHSLLDYLSENIEKYKKKRVYVRATRGLMRLAQDGLAFKSLAWTKLLE